MKDSVIILAAGRGTRFEGVKQDVVFHGKPLWQFPYETAASVVGADRVVVVGKDVPGGETRACSVRCGLEALPTDTDRAVIIEAARPMVTRAQILEILAQSHPSLTMAKPLVNTVMYRDGSFVDRNLLYDLLTPQCFDYKMLLEAYRSGRFYDVTDETRVMFEYHGIRPKFVETGSNLYKVTYPGDLAVIEAIYQLQLQKGERTE